MKRDSKAETNGSIILTARQAWLRMSGPLSYELLSHVILLDSTGSQALNVSFEVRAWVKQLTFCAELLSSAGAS